VENVSVNHHESNCSISLLLNLKHVVISTLLTDYTKPTMFTESIEPLMLTKFTEPIINIESIEFTKSNKSTNTESTESIVFVEPTTSAFVPIVSIESDEISISTTKSTKSIYKRTESKATSRRIKSNTISKNPK
ncbi:31029_t:CDS:2, partial [Racocetra persica]